MSTIYYRDGRWEQSAEMTVPMGLHGLWNGSVIFDGARVIDGTAPDLLLHCQRLTRHAPEMALHSPLSASDIARLACEGAAMFAPDAELYIRPMLFGNGEALFPPARTEFILQVQEYPMPRGGFAACTTSLLRRPSKGVLPVAYKSGWLYLHCLREIALAKDRGFQEVVMLNPDGDVVEFAGSNLFYARNGIVYTPAINGCFLPGVTRRRVIELLREMGVELHETRVELQELFQADEIFSSGNMAKVRPLIRLDDKELPVGPIYRAVEQAYRRFADQWPLSRFREITNE